MNESIGLGLGIRRRVIFFFLLLIFIVFFPSVLIIRQWLVVYLDRSETESLKQGYSFVSAFLDTKKYLLQDLAKSYSRNPEVLDHFKGQALEELRTPVGVFKKSSGMDFIIILNDKGKVIGGDGVFNKFFLRDSALFENIVSVMDRAGGASSGFLHTADDKMWLVAFAQIMAPHQPSGRLGTIMLGITLGDEVFKGLNLNTNLDIEIFHSLDLLNYANPIGQDEMASVRSSFRGLLYSQRVFNIYKQETSDGGDVFYLDAVIRDITNEAVGVLRIRSLAPAYLWVNRFLAMFFLCMFFIFLFSSWIMARFLTKHISLPLVKLRNTIREITSSKNLSKRLERGLEDEIGGLIVEFNSMLEELEKMNLKIRRSGEEMSMLYKDLLEQKKFTSEILSIAPSVVLVLLPDGRVKFVNEAIERIAGYKSEEVANRDWFDMFVPFGRRQEAKAIFSNLIKGDIEPYKQIESNILTKDNVERIMLWSNSLFLDRDGRVSSVISMGQDITEYKKIETELVKKMNDLERFYRVTMDREKIVIQLKNEIRALKAKVCKEDEKTV